jgi:hypothetical protein
MFVSLRHTAAVILVAPASNPKRNDPLTVRYAHRSSPCKLILPGKGDLQQFHRGFVSIDVVYHHSRSLYSLGVSVVTVKAVARSGSMGRIS